MQYEESLKYYRDLKNSLDTAREEGLKEGEMRKQVEIAKKLKKIGMSIHEIENITGLNRQDLMKL